MLFSPHFFFPLLRGFRFKRFTQQWGLAHTGLPWTCISMDIVQFTSCWPARCVVTKVLR
jgi:hypothetical protein